MNQHHPFFLYLSVLHKNFRRESDWLSLGHMSIGTLTDRTSQNAHKAEEVASHKAVGCISRRRRNSPRKQNKHSILISFLSYMWVRFLMNGILHLPSSDFHSLSSTIFTSSLKASVTPPNILAANGCDFGPVLPSSGSQFPHLSHEGIPCVCKCQEARSPGDQRQGPKFKRIVTNRFQESWQCPSRRNDNKPSTWFPSTIMATDWPG